MSTRRSFLNGLLCGAVAGTVAVSEVARGRTLEDAARDWQGRALRAIEHPQFTEVPGCDHFMCPCHDVCWKCGTTRQALEELPCFSEASLEEMLIEVRKSVIDRGQAIRLRPTKVYPVL